VQRGSWRLAYIARDVVIVFLDPSPTLETASHCRGEWVVLLEKVSKELEVE
jgi:hypothetical protein